MSLSLLSLLLAAGLSLFVVLVLPRTWSGSASRARLRRPHQSAVPGLP